MIHIDGIQIKLEGSFKTIIGDIAKVIHAVSKEVAKSSDKDVSYDHAVIAILEEVAQYKQLDVNNSSGIPDELLTEFYESVAEEREKNRKNPKHTFIDFDSERPTAVNNRGLLRGIINEVYADERSGVLDKEDLKAIKKANKTKKD